MRTSLQSTAPNLQQFQGANMNEQMEILNLDFAYRRPMSCGDIRKKRDRPSLSDAECEEIYLKSYRKCVNYFTKVFYPLMQAYEDRDDLRQEGALFFFRCLRQFDRLKGSPARSTRENFEAYFCVSAKMNAKGGRYNAARASCRPGSVGRDEVDRIHVTQSFELESLNAALAGRSREFLEVFERCVCDEEPFDLKTFHDMGFVPEDLIEHVESIYEILSQHDSEKGYDDLIRRFSKLERDLDRFRERESNFLHLPARVHRRPTCLDHASRA
jgi:hypothetical protein